MAENSYPYPSSLNIDNFVTIKLSNSSNYNLWKAQIICLLESQELVGFIDGTNLIHLPLLDLKWKRSDRLVKGWIFGSLAEEYFSMWWRKLVLEMFGWNWRKFVAIIHFTIFTHLNWNTFETKNGNTKMQLN
ncbi:hypothetical protein AABB24_008133 [Solanum stoloniferum]|uniref:Retrotransposon Copia-like N-terminal domain-containing protein n=1 Tax=Solanum stoloniferum TaxID=62892 RepID=A0ABD2URI7_9SOLN